MGSLTREYVLLGLLALLWSLSYIFTKIAVAEIPFLTLTAVRAWVAAGVLLITISASGDALPTVWTTWRTLFVQAIFNSIGAWTAIAWAQQRIDAALACVLSSTSPIFVFEITVLWTRHESAGLARLLGAGVGLAGVVAIVGVDGDMTASVLGCLAALLGGALYGGAAVYGKRLAHVAPAASAAGTMLWAAVVLTPLAVAVEAPWRLRPSLEALGAAFALSTACTAGALFLYFRLVRTLGSMGVASQSYLRAGLGAALGVVLLGETLSLTAAIGIALVISGVVLLNRHAHVSPKPTARPIL